MEIEKTNIKWYIIFIILLVVSAFVISLVRADDIIGGQKEIFNTTYTASSDTVCDSKGRCTLTQYSGIRYVQEDNQWKPYENARSLKDKGFGVQYIEDDKNYVIDVLDFNATSIQLSLSKDLALTKSESIPLRIWSENNTKEKLTGDFKQDYTKIEDTSISLSPLKQSESLIINLKLGDIIEYGPNSTSISINSTQIIKDTIYASSSPTTNYGSDTSYPIKNVTTSNNTDYMIMMFNTSAIPTSATIENALLNLYVVNNGLDVGTEGYDMTTYWVYANFSWNETTATWNNERPNRTIDMLTTENNGYYHLFGGAGELGFGDRFDLDVTNLTNYSYFNNEKNLTLLIVPNMFGTPLIADTVTLTLSESTAAQGPNLKITYSIITPPGGSCTYTSGNWNINTADNCTISSNVDLGGNSLILNWTGTLVLNANLSNKGFIIPSNMSKIVLGNGSIIR